MKLKRNGFSLVEVNLAIFVISIGLLTLFSLFPAGLKEGEAGHADTQTSLFCDYVLGTIRANSMAVKAKDWDNLSSPYNDLLYDLPGTVNEGGNRPSKVQYPIGSGLYVRYYLDIVENGDLYGVRLWTASGEYGTKVLKEFKDSAEMYYTELFFSGMP